MNCAGSFTKPCFTILAILVASLAWGQSTTAPSTAPPVKPAPAAATPAPNSLPAANAMPEAPKAVSDEQGVEPLVGVGDLVKISVLGVPDYDQEVRVGGDGAVHLAMVGSVHIAGFTTNQAQEAIRKRLMDGGFFADPQVAVMEKDFATQGVSVIGEVQKPGVYAVTGPRRLFDVLSLAGGTTNNAGQVVTITHRNNPQAMQNVTMSRDPAENQRANVDIRPGDTVVVSKAGVVYVVGAVKRPTHVILENNGNISVLQAIAMSEGTEVTAKLSSAKIIRRTATGRTDIPIDLKKIMNSQAQDVQLQAEDIVFVPTSKGKMAAGTAMESIVRVATSLASYAVFY